jgi:hypothetical protein
MFPLLDRTGITKAWADRQTAWISDLTGRVFALVWCDGVFDRGGAQVGWWHGNYILGRHGHLVLYRPNARIQNLSMPQARKIPRPPNLHLPSGHPTLRWLLMPPRKKPLWGDFTTFYDGLGPSRTAVGRLREFQERAGGRY